MKHGSLFSGIGGFDLAAEWMGWENMFHCEWNPFGQKVLNYYWPNAKSYGDITKTDFTEWRGKIDIVSGGFPCQPFSQAGKRKGKEDDRFLWPEMLRAIREIQPSWVVAENVYGIINQGRGLVFEQVCSEMENEGYQVQPYILPASGIGAFHKRERCWFVAYNDGYGCNRSNGKNEINTDKRRKYALDDTKPVFNPNADSSRQQERRAERRTQRQLASTFPLQIESSVCGANDGLSGWVDRLKGLGNAIVPQVAYEIFKSIEKYESL